MDNRISIFGSCVTRDAFEYRNRPGDVASYAARASFPVAASVPAPVPGHVDYAHLSDWHQKTYEMFYSKGYIEEIQAADPDYLLIDLIDDRFFYLCGDTIIPGIAEFLQITRYGASDHVAVDYMDSKGFSMWSEYAALFLQRLKMFLPASQVIIHCAWWAGDPVQCANDNALLARKYGWLRQELVGAHFVEVEDDHLVVNPTHRWGAQPFHYVDSYYERLNEIVTDVISVPSHAKNTVDIKASSPIEGMPAHLDCTII